MKHFLFSSFIFLFLFFSVKSVSATGNCSCAVSINQLTTATGPCSVSVSVAIDGTNTRGDLVESIYTAIADNESKCPGIETVNTPFTDETEVLTLESCRATVPPTGTLNTVINATPRTFQGFNDIDFSCDDNSTVATTTTFSPPSSVPLINPLTGTDRAQNIPEFVGGIIQRLLGILGSISLVVFMYGAFKWITSEGESDDIEEGTHTMAYAAIGILVIFASYGILSSVIGGITGG